MNPLHRRILFLSGGVLLLVAIAIIVFGGEKPPPPAEKPVAAPRESTSPRAERRFESGPVIEPREVARGTPQDGGSSVTVEEASNEILKLSTQYAPESVPLIAPYLTNPEKKIRVVALEGMLNLGETSG